MNDSGLSKYRHNPIPRKRDPAYMATRRDILHMIAPVVQTLLSGRLADGLKPEHFDALFSLMVADQEAFLYRHYSGVSADLRNMESWTTLFSLDKTSPLGLRVQSQWSASPFNRASKRRWRERERAWRFRSRLQAPPIASAPPEE